MGRSGHIPPLRLIGRCELFGEIGSGGMATVHLGRLLATGGFTKIVAIKRMHEQLSKDPQFVAMFLDEARLVARIKQPNVRPTLDLIEEDGELFIVMEYVPGVSLRRLFFDVEEGGERMPREIAIRVSCDVLHGLQAAHDATGPDGEALELVHRDVSPENILVGADGLARLLDFGMARALGRLHLTQPGLVKGKLTVMAPEQVQGKPVSRRTDVFAVGVVLWQALTARRLILGEHIAEVAHNVLNQEFEAPSKVVADVPAELDEIVMRALARDPEARWPSAEAMATALEGFGEMATTRRVSEWLRAVASEPLAEREAMVTAIERTPVGLTPQQRPTGGAGDNARDRYIWASAMANVERVFRDLREAVAAAIQRDDAGRLVIPATVKTIATTLPRASLAFGLGVVLLLTMVLVIAFSGGDDAVAEAPAASAAVSAAPGEKPPKPPTPPTATASAPAPEPVKEDPRATVAAGQFTLGCNTWADRLCGSDELPPTPVDMDAFSIDRYEVTVAAYDACVKAGKCTTDNLTRQGAEGGQLEEIDRCNHGRSGRENHPLNCVTYAQAAAYCSWAGGRLPSEAEWEKAAAGSDDWPLPHGQPSMTCEDAVMSDKGDGCGRGTTWPVGSKPKGKSPYGLYDVAGNVAEWVADWYEPTFQTVAPKNPKGPAQGTQRVVRGGSWRDQAVRMLRTSARAKRPPETRAIEVGFRCAY